jgi:hypothetical protein
MWHLRRVSMEWQISLKLKEIILMYKAIGGVNCP